MSGRGSFVAPFLSKVKVKAVFLVHVYKARFGLCISLIVRVYRDFLVKVITTKYHQWIQPQKITYDIVFIHDLHLFLFLLVCFSRPFRTLSMVLRQACIKKGFLSTEHVSWTKIYVALLPRANSDCSGSAEVTHWYPCSNRDWRGNLNQKMHSKTNQYALRNISFITARVGVHGCTYTYSMHVLY